MKYEDLECEDYLIEKAILEEDPYNWKKHFIHQLPFLIYFFGKWIVIFLVFQAVLMSMASAVVQTMLQLQGSF